MVPRRTFCFGLGALSSAGPLFARRDSVLPASIRQSLMDRNGAAVILRARGGKTITACNEDLAYSRLIRPGSAWKPVIADLLAAEPPKRCEPVQRIGGRRLDCTHPMLPFPLDLRAALAYSCNSYFLSSHLDFDALRVRARTCGWFTAPGGARPGSLLRPRSPDEARLQLVGEWGVETTLAGLAEAYRRLAREQSGPVVDGLAHCVREGTGQLAAVPGLTVAGKTGTTAEPGTSRLQALFVGWAPARAPRWVVAVWLPSGKGGTDAAPLAGEIFAWLLAAKSDWRHGRDLP